MKPILFALFSGLSLAHADPLPFKPLSLECSIFASNFPGVPNLEKDYRVTLRGDNSKPEGHVKLASLGKYDFWIVTGPTLSDGTNILVSGYEAEIRNRQTGEVAQAMSDEFVSVPGIKISQIAKVSLARYDGKGKDRFLETASLRLYCHKSNNP